MTRRLLPIAVGYALPYILLKNGLIDKKREFFILMVMTAIVILDAHLRRRTWKQLGFRSDNLKQALILNGILCVVIVAVMVLLKGYEVRRLADFYPYLGFYLPYVLLYSPAQEFIFRSYLFTEYEHAGIKNGVALVLLTAIPYALIHSIVNTWSAVGFSFIMGLLWGVIYYKVPNFYGVALSHCIIGVVSIMLKLI